jgi:hypothetical protein
MVDLKQEKNIDKLINQYQEYCEFCIAPPGTRCESAIPGCIYNIFLDIKEVDISIDESQ